MLIFNLILELSKETRLRFRNPIIGGIPDSGAQNYGFFKQKFRGFWIRDAKISQILKFG